MSPLSAAQSREFLLDAFKAGVAAADPARKLHEYLPKLPAGRAIVVGAGKAAASMAAAVEKNWPGALFGLVICPHGYSVPTERIEVVEAGHPIPDSAGRKAAGRILSMVEGLGEADLVLALISGGGSALLSMPAVGLSLEDKQSVTRGLLMSGASIDEINCVRKHLSAVKGGRLAAAAWPAATHALIVSDVAGDDPAIIASGPTVADPTSAADAAAILKRYWINVPFAVDRFLKSAEAETPKSGDAKLSRSSYDIVVRPADALQAGAAFARAAGIEPVLLGDAIEGEAREAARVLAGIASSVVRLGMPVRPPCLLLSGGETTVTVRGKGRGGPNIEFALALALALDGRAGVSAIACDTDGADGFSGSAGAIVLPDTLVRARAAGLDPRSLLADNDSAKVFQALGDLVVTGPTRTNVNDFRAILVTGA